MFISVAGMVRNIFKIIIFSLLKRTGTQYCRICVLNHRLITKIHFAEILFYATFVYTSCFMYKLLLNILVLPLDTKGRFWGFPPPFVCIFILANARRSN